MKDMLGQEVTVGNYVAIAVLGSKHGSPMRIGVLTSIEEDKVFISSQELKENLLDPNKNFIKNKRRIFSTYKISERMIKLSDTQIFSFIKTISS